jgi:hypothetical protein
MTCPDFGATMYGTIVGCGSNVLGSFQIQNCVHAYNLHPELQQLRFCCNGSSYTAEAWTGVLASYSVGTVVSVNTNPLEICFEFRQQYPGPPNLFAGCEVLTICFTL